MVDTMYLSYASFWENKRWPSHDLRWTPWATSMSHLADMLWAYWHHSRSNNSGCMPERSIQQMENYISCAPTCSWIIILNSFWNLQCISPFFLIQLVWSFPRLTSCAISSWIPVYLKNQIIDKLTKKWFLKIYIVDTSPHPFWVWEMKARWKFWESHYLY